MPDRAWLALATLVAIGVCIPGLHGPLLLDDGDNFRTYDAWLAGRTTWLDVVFGNASGPSGRPLSMLSFVATGLVGGGSVLAMKAGNLSLHVVNAWLVGSILARVFARDPATARHATLLGAAIAAIWLVNPMHTSTVFYAVQRMTLVSGCFVLASVSLYAWARTRPGASLGSTLALFVGVPFLFACAVLSKESGVAAPLLCLALELAYFTPHRDRRIVAFHAVFLVVPAVAALALFALSPERILSGYWLRDFSAYERLLTQARVLWSYAASFVFPGGGSLGIYTDDFVPSRSLLQPITTVVSLVAWGAVVVLAVIARKRLPLAFLGIAWFLAGHALEASIVPLELYFEHRNYVPSLGILLVALALGARLLRHPDTSSLRRWAPAFALLLFVVLATATAARALVWQDERALVESSLAHHPGSTRARLDYAALLLEDRRYEDAMAVLRRFASSPRREERALGLLAELGASCHLSGVADGSRLSELEEHVGDRLYYLHLVGVQGLADQLWRGCTGIDRAEYARFVVRLVEASPQPEEFVVKWKLRFAAAYLLDRAALPREAFAQANRAWATRKASPAVGGFAAELAISLGECAAATRLIAEVEASIGRFQAEPRRQVARLRRLLAEKGCAAALDATVAAASA